MLRVPVDSAIARDHLVLPGRRADVPRHLGVVEEGRAATPAEGIRVPIRRCVAEQQAALTQVAGDFLVGVFDELAGAGKAIQNDASVIHRVDGLESERLAQGCVLRAVGDRRVDDARAVRRRHVISRKNAMRVPRQRRADVRRVVLDARQGFAGEPRDLPPAVAENVALQRGCDDRATALLRFGEDVLFPRADGKRHVRRERPGRRRPRNESRALGYPTLAVIAEADKDIGGRAVALGLRLARREAHVHARVRRVLLVPERYLMRAEARHAARTVGRYAVVLVDETLIPQALEHPPRRFDVGVVIGNVGGVHIQPHARTLGHRLPIANVAEDALAAAAIELLDAELLDLVLGGEAQLLLDLKLDRKAVGVPPAAADRTVAPHRLIAEDDILERARQHMVDAGASVRSGRALVEDEQRRIRANAIHLTEGSRLSSNVRVWIAPDPGS